MADLLIRGGLPISGTLTPSGNKNAVLPIICASLLSSGQTVLTNVPEISDVEKLLSYFRDCGSQIDWRPEEHRLTITHDETLVRTAEAELPVGIRSAVLLLAPVLIRRSLLTFDTEAKGCALGLREIDPHLSILEDFGCAIEETRPYRLSLSSRPRGQDIWSDYASVTATETFIMMAVLCDGVSTLTNAACEPHVQALCEFLMLMGAKIDGVGTSRLTITGVDTLGTAEFAIPHDHHEIATFLAIGGVTGGRVTVKTNMTPHMPLILRQFGKMGLDIATVPQGLEVRGWSRQIEKPYTDEMIPKIEAAPWPYFPADLLPQAIGVAVGCEGGELLFWNKVYEGALGWTAELSKFGAKVHLSDPHRLIVFGGNRLRPATVEAPYIIRVVLSLFIAAIQIEGVSIIRNADPIKRAHPQFVENLTRMGAEVQWI